MPAFLDRTGQRFGRLVVIERAPHHRRMLWRCRCDCGQEIVTRGEALKDGTTRSCGCLYIELARSRFLKHGHTSKGHTSATYRCWSDMMSRCTNSHNPSYKDYGGRGIAVCERWLSFPNFLADMGEKPAGLSIDRVNNELGYFPENCGWTTPAEQALNRRQTSKLTAEQVISIRSDPRGKRKLAEQYHVAPSTIWRIKQYKVYKRIP